jgi:hypothetical protein
MSRAFVRDDDAEIRPRLDLHLPPRDDPSFDAAAAAALLEGARVSEVVAAEEATGCRWGEPRLRPHVERLLARARAEQDERLEQVAERFLKVPAR